MRIAYTLAESDLAAVLLQQGLWRRDRSRAWFEAIRTGPFLRNLLFNVVPGALFGLLLYPSWRALLRGLHLRSLSASIYVAAVAVAVLLGTLLQRWKAPPRPKFAGLYRWSANRRLRTALRKSVLGDVEIAVGEEGLVRVNAKGELRIRWSEVIALLESSSVFTIVLAGNRVVIAPRRAFQDPSGARAFQAEVERRVGKKAIPVPDAP